MVLKSFNLNAADIKGAELRRLTWRCRRGMLELDIVLQRFIATHFAGLSKQQLVAFDALLAMPDNDFWNLISNSSLEQNIDINSSQQQLINKLNLITVSVRM